MTKYNIPNTKYQSGFSQIILVVFLLAGIIILSGVSYYILKAQGKAPVGGTTYTTTTDMPTTAPVAQTSVQKGVEAISNSKDLKTIETEINSTDIDSVDSDLNSLDASASSL